MWLLNLVFRLGSFVINLLIELFFVNFFGNIDFILILFSFNLRFDLWVMINSLWVIFVFDKLLCGFGLVKLFFFVFNVVLLSDKLFWSVLNIYDNEFDRILLNLISLLFVLNNDLRLLSIGKFVFMFVLYKNLWLFFCVVVIKFW